MAEVRVGSIVIDRDREDDTTYLGDVADFKKFKIEVNSRLDKLEEEVKRFKAVKKIEHTK